MAQLDIPIAYQTKEALKIYAKEHKQTLQSLVAEIILQWQLGNDATYEELRDHSK